MSALSAPLEGRAAPPPRPLRRGRLRVVPRPPVRLARIPFLGVLIAVFGVGMAGLLMLNTSLQTQAFEARALSRQATELAYRQAELESQISMRAAPQELARRASALGLRTNPYPAFLVIPDGRVIGKPQPVVGKEVPSLIVRTPQELAAARAKGEAKRRAAAVAKAAQQRAAQLAAAQAAAAAQAQAEQAAAAARQAAARAGTGVPAPPAPTPSLPAGAN